MGDFAVVIEQPGGLLMFMQEGEGPDPERPCRFETREAAFAAVKGAMWEYAWPWWVVELVCRGRSVYGPDAAAKEGDRGR